MLDSATASPTCTRCGAPLAAPALPCPYCGQAPIAFAAAPPAPGQPWPPGQAPTWPAAPGPGQVWAGALAPPIVVVRRRSAFGCGLGITALVLVIIAIPVYFAVTAIRAATQAVANIPALAVFNLTPQDPVQAAADHLDQLNAYMQAGLHNTPDAAYALYIHDGAWDPSSRAAIATEFQTHREHYAGFQSLQPIAFLRVHATGGPSFWQVRAWALYADGAPRAVQADLAQQGGWQLIQVKFTDRP